MKKSIKTSLHISLVLAIAGVAIVFISLLCVGFDFSKFSDMTFEKKVFDIKDSFEVVHIMEETDDIEFYPSDDKTCKIVCYNSDRAYHECFVDKESNKLENNYLRVLYRDKREWYEKFMPLFKGDRKLQIYLPEKAYNELAVHSVNSSISVPSDFTFDNASISTVNGKINVDCDVKERIHIETTNGDIKVNGKVNGEVGFMTTNGKINVKNIANARSAGFMTVNGDISFYGDVINTISVTSTNGSIQFGDIHSEHIVMSTVNGNIKGTLLSKGDFSVYTENGSINVPESKGNNFFRFDTVNGDIDIKEK